MYGSTSEDPGVNFASPGINEDLDDLNRPQFRRTESHTTLEHVNYARISCLLMQEGTKRMQIKVVENLPERQTLEQVLANKTPKLQDLRKLKVITRSQYDVLFPFTDDTLSKIDIPLWIILARNITVKNSKKGIDWSKSPEPHETHWGHDMIRLREIRNFLFHVSAPELTSEKFNNTKMDLIRTLKRLGSTDDVISDHMTRDLDPQQTKICELQIREQSREEQIRLLHESVKQKKQTKIFTGVLTILAALVVVGVSVPVVWYFQQKKPCTPYIQRISSDSGTMSYMSRKAWGAKPATDSSDPIPPLKKPVKQAVVFHTAFVKDQCKVTEDCCDEVRGIQERQMSGIWADISYNYLIGDDGVIYEGRGSSVTGASAWGRNSEIISITLIGNYACARPSNTALVALYVFLEYITVKEPSTGEEDPILDPEYKLYGHCQINLQTPEHNKTFVDSPGAATMHEIMYWEHWHPDNITQCNIDKDCVKSSLCCKTQCNATKNIVDT